MANQNVWILGEQENGTIRLVTYELLRRGRALADKRGCQLVAVLLGEAFESNNVATLYHYGADQVLVVAHPVLKYYLPEPYINTLLHLIRKYQPEIMIASATTTGRSVMPALAVKCATGLTADCTDLDIEDETGNLIQTRPAIGGNILATIKTPLHRPQMATVRPHSNKPLPPDPARTGTLLTETVAPELLSSRIKRLALHANVEEAANIQDAEIVVAGGKGFKKSDHFQMVGELAAILKGAVGATRDAVDLGWATYPHQVGLSGKTVSPKLYIGIGISGSVQHLAGIKTAENIVAINNDPEAQLFQVANFGIVADLFEAVPLLLEKLRARANSRNQGDMQA